MFRIARWVFLAAAAGASILSGGYLLARLQDPRFAPELMMCWVAACTLWVMFAAVYTVHKISTKGAAPFAPSARREPHSQPRSVDAITASAHVVPRPRVPESPGHQILPELPADNRPTVILPVTADCDDATVRVDRMISVKEAERQMTALMKVVERQTTDRVLGAIGGFVPPDDDQQSAPTNAPTSDGHEFDGPNLN